MDTVLEKNSSANDHEKILMDVGSDKQLSKPQLMADATSTSAKDNAGIISNSAAPTAVTMPKESISSLTEENAIVLPEGANAGILSSGNMTKNSKRKREEDLERNRLKRRKIKAAGAPKMPLTGYVRYMNDRREKLRAEMPDKTAMEHTKIISEEWNQLAEERKAPYITAAKIDRDRYMSELNAFLKDRPDILEAELAKSKSRKLNGPVNKSAFAEKTNGSNTASTVKDVQTGKQANKLVVTPGSATYTRRLSVNYSMPVAIAARAANNFATNSHQNQLPEINSNNNMPTSATVPVPGSIPIFTEEFLEHNKIFDMELRTLRKSKSDFEQQNSVLEKHVENMKFGVEKMANENDELQEKNRLLEAYLEKLKLKLAQALSGLAIPTEPNGATVDNIDKYMKDLYNMATTNTHGPASLNKAKDIIRKLDLHIQL